MKKLIFIVLLWLISLNVFADHIKQIIFFGDSLSDNGNLYKLFAHIIPKSPPYYQGRFSNGPTWAEHVGQYYHDQYRTHYTINAYGGATAFLHQPTTRFIAPTTLKFEIYHYLLDAAFKDKSKILYVIWIGGNDYLFDREKDVNELSQQVVDQIIFGMRTLMNEGGKYFLILNMPNLSRVPFARANNIVERLYLLSKAHNEKLKSAINEFKNNYPNIQLTLVNIYDVFNDVIDHPEKYNEKYHINIKNTQDACWQGSYTINDQMKNMTQDLFQQALTPNQIDFVLTSPELIEAYHVGKQYEQGILPCENADEYLFWDNIHPTHLVHKILSQIVIENLQTMYR